MPAAAARLGSSLALIAVAALVAAGTGTAGTTATRGVTYKGSQIVPGQVIVSYVAGTTTAERRATRRGVSGRLAQTLSLPRTEVVELADGTSVAEAIAAFEDDPDVAYAEPNYVYKISALPNDTLFSVLWGLDQASDKDIDAPEAWDVTTGSSSIVVAVVDSGVAYDHPDLAGNIWTNNDPPGGGDNDSNGFVDDMHGWDFIGHDNTPFDANEHGTHVAGTIGAVGNNLLGVTGVNWDVSLMPLRAGDASGSLPGLAIFQALTYACANGARVVNGSFGGGGPSQATLELINSAACSKTLFVFAAGNGGSDQHGDNNETLHQYPCDYVTTRIICVAATDLNDSLAGFSNFGTTSVDLAAPGVDIRSAQPTFGNVLTDGFEGNLATFNTRWGGQTGPISHPTWGQDNVVHAGGSSSLSDSPGAGVDYSSNTDTSIRALSAANLSGRAACSLMYAMNLETEAGFDFLTIEASNSSGGPWTDVSQGGWSGSTDNDFYGFQEDVGAFDGDASVFLRFRLRSDVNTEGDGVHIDDIELTCAGAPSPTGNYRYLSGTSMATPHVAGAAALVLSRNPNLTPAQVRTLILSNVDPVAGLSGKVVTAGRLNVNDAVLDVDVTKPNTSITAGPRSRTKSRTATFKFKSTETGSTFKCKLDGGAFTACSSGKTYRNLKKGSHTFQVRATDKFGNLDATPAKKTWKIVS